MKTTIKGSEKISAGRGYFVYNMGGKFFAIFNYGDGEVQFLSKPYGTENGANKALASYLLQAEPLRA